MRSPLFAALALTSVFNDLRLTAIGTQDVLDVAEWYSGTEHDVGSGSARN